MMGHGFYYQLFANGREGLPTEISHEEKCYKLQTVLKYDFFAGTGLYQLDGEGGQKVVLKMGRDKHFLGLPLAWLGRIMRGHEVGILEELCDVDRVPKVLFEYGKAGFVYEFIEGKTLLESTDVGEGFFDELAELLAKLHERNIAYVDMNKRDNIICGDDGKPYLIDFQISRHFKGRVPILRIASDYIKAELFKADLYHLYKHKRKIQPTELKPEESAIAEPNVFIKIHRFFANPYRKVRRWLLGRLERGRASA